MRTYIVLLRGINVGGHKKIPMAILRDVLTSCGFQNVKTYIQSGNIILQTSESQIEQIESKVQDAIAHHFGFEVPVIAKTREALESIFETCPFSEEEKVQSYFVILNNVPDRTLVDEAMKITFQNETYQILKDCLYFYSSIGYGNSKFNMNTFEKKLDVKATSRNYNTLVKLLELSL